MLLIVLLYVFRSLMLTVHVLLIVGSMAEKQQTVEDANMMDVEERKGENGTKDKPELSSVQQATNEMVKISLQVCIYYGCFNLVLIEM